METPKFIGLLGAAMGEQFSRLCFLIHKSPSRTIHRISFRQPVNSVRLPRILQFIQQVLKTMLFTQDFLSVACVMFLLWVLYYMNGINRAVMNWEQRVDNQQHLTVRRQNVRGNEQNLNTRVLSNRKYPEEHDERQS